MDTLPDFELLTPKNAQEAVSLHAERDEARYMAGGTDFMPNLRRGIESPMAVIDLSGIEEMRGIEILDDGRLRIGASTTLVELCRDERIIENFPAVAEAAEQIAGTSHRQVATVGGNLCLDTRCLYYNQSEWWRSANNYCLKKEGEICHVAPTGKTCRAAYSGDLAPTMLIHGAMVEIASATGSRTIDLAELYQEDGADFLLLEPGELMVAVTIEPRSGYSMAYKKVRVRGGVDFPLVGVAAALKIESGKIDDLKIGLTGTNSKPVRLEGLEDVFGKPMDDETLKVIEKLVQRQIQPMRSTFTPSHYRRKVALNVTRRLISRLATT